MRRLVFLQSAQHDIDAIQEYSKIHWGSLRAKRTLILIQQCAYLLCEHPELGKGSRVANVRQKAVPRLPFLILYQDTPTEILVVQVLHTRRQQ